MYAHDAYHIIKTPTIQIKHYILYIISAYTKMTIIIFFNIMKRENNV